MNIMDINVFLAQIKRNFESRCEIPSSFIFIHSDTSCSQSVNHLKKSTVRFARKHSHGSSEVELSSEIESFKYFSPLATPSFGDTELTSPVVYV